MSITMSVASAPAQLLLSQERRGPQDAEASTNIQTPTYKTQSPSTIEPSSQSRFSASPAWNRITRAFLLVETFSLAPSPLANFYQFDKSVDDATLSRFKYIHTRIEKPLLEYICKKIPKLEYRPIAIRLMVLGHSEPEAKPCIVVLCPEKQSKTAKKFFEKSSVTKLCRPDDHVLPSFEAIVLGRPPDLKLADKNVDVFVPIPSQGGRPISDTYCGTPIIIHQHSALAKKSTLGGIIKVTWPEGNSRLFGLTVGHILFGDSEDDLPLGPDTDQDRDLYDCGFELSDSDTETLSDNALEQEPDWEFRSPSRAHGPEPIPADITVSSPAFEFIKIGSISDCPLQHPSGVARTKYDKPSAYYDWALIDMLTYKPNRIRPRGLPYEDIGEGKPATSEDLKFPARSSSSSGNRDSVILVSNTNEIKSGHLSALPSRLLLGPSKEFIDILVLNLDDNKVIHDGDSGSWVVNESTLEVHGYVVAADAFGGGYVVPLEDAFKNIRDTLGCQSVGLATTADIEHSKHVPQKIPAETIHLSPHIIDDDKVILKAAPHSLDTPDRDDGKVNISSRFENSGMESLSLSRVPEDLSNIGGQPIQNEEELEHGASSQISSSTNPPYQTTSTMIDPIGAVAAATATIDQSLKLIRRVSTAIEIHKNGRKDLEFIFNDLSSIAQVIELVQTIEEIRTKGVLKALANMLKHAEKLDDHVQQVKKKSSTGSSFRRAAHHFMTGPEDLEQTNRMVNELASLKTTLILHIQVAHVGLVVQNDQDKRENPGCTLMLDSLVLHEVNQIVEQRLGKGQGLKIAEVLHGKKPDGNGMIYLTQEEYECLMFHDSGDDQGNKQFGTIRVANNHTFDQALQINGFISDDWMEFAQNLTIENNQARSQSIQVNVPTKRQDFSELLAERRKTLEGMPSSGLVTGPANATAGYRKPAITSHFLP